MTNISDKMKKILEGALNVSVEYKRTLGEYDLPEITFVINGEFEASHWDTKKNTEEDLINFTYEIAERYTRHKVSAEIAKLKDSVK